MNISLGDIAQWGILLITLCSLIYAKIRSDAKMEIRQKKLEDWVDDKDKSGIICPSICDNKTERLESTMGNISEKLTTIESRLDKLAETQRNDRVTRDQRLADIQRQLNHLQDCQDKQREIISKMPEMQATVTQLKESTDKLNEFLMDLVRKHFN